MNYYISSLIVLLASVIRDSMIFWLPIILIAVAIKIWKHYITEQAVARIEWILLEVRVPQEVTKSPMAMELFLTNSLYLAGGFNWSNKWIEGWAREWSSLEMVSKGGNIHFILRVPTHAKNLVESQLYAQYPQVEVNQLSDDYVYGVPRLQKNPGWDAWGCEFTLEKPDPLPIKTYVDYGLDKNPKEEEKIDPITSTIELLGSIGPNEQIWIQIGIQATLKMYHSHGTRYGKHNWNEEVAHFVDERTKIYTDNNKFLPKAVEEEIKAVYSKADKLAFDCVIRCIYAAPVADFKAGTRKSMTMLFRQYSSPVKNSLKRVNSTQFDYEWHDRDGSLTYLKDKMLDYYRERVFFHPPFRRSFAYVWPFNLFYPTNAPQVCVLNSEELASLYHFPGSVSAAPTLARVSSKTSTAPFNLPI